MNPNYKQKIGFLDLIWHYKYQLAVYIFVVSFITFSVLYYVGGVPEELRVLDASTFVGQADTSASTSLESKKTTGPITLEQVQPDLPRKIIIDKINVNSSVSTPTSANNSVLNEYLLRGAVRYPGSGSLGQGNLFIFGHSSSLKIVNNQAFKTFNNLKNLNIDDEIKVQSAKKEYTYKVVTVMLVDSDKALVDLTSKKNMLTLSTCNTFGEKQERYVVEALFISSKDL